MIWSIARKTGWKPDFIQWELDLLDVMRFLHAELWLEGNRCKRTVGYHSPARKVFDTIAKIYGKSH